MKNEGRLLSTPNSLTTLGKPLLATWKGNMNNFSTDFSACIYLPKVSHINIYKQISHIYKQYNKV